MAAHVNIGHFVRTAREDRSIVSIVKQFAGSCRSRHKTVGDSSQQTAYARPNYINPKGTPLVLDHAGPKLRAGLRLAPEKLPSIPTMTEARPTTTRGVQRIHFLLLSISKITKARENVPTTSAPAADQLDTPLAGRFTASCTDRPKPPAATSPAHAPTIPPPSWAMM